MKRSLFLMVAALLCSGCTHHTLFALFSDSYSAGGESYGERKQHFDQQMEKWEGP